VTKVLALDPGDRVGWARADVADDGTWTEFRHGITPLRDMATAVYYVKKRYDVMVCEDFRLYPQMARSLVGSSFPSVQFIGMVRLCCWLADIEFVLQGARAKEMADRSMKKLCPDLYNLVTTPRAHDDAHDHDAIRHLWTWTMKNTELAK
jgi:hypothetical protein